MRAATPAGSGESQLSGTSNTLIGSLPPFSDFSLVDSLELTPEVLISSIAYHVKEVVSMIL